MRRVELDDAEVTYKFCKNCNKVIPKIKTDTLGRRTTKTSDFCCKLCCNKYMATTLHPGYFQTYYLKNKDKYKKETSKNVQQQAGNL